MWCGTRGCSKERTVGVIEREKELRHSGSVGLGEPILGRGAGWRKQVGEAGAYTLVEGAMEEKVGNVLNGGRAVGARGGGAGCGCQCSGRVGVSLGSAGRAEPVAIGNNAKGRVKAVGVPGSIARVAE